MRCVLITPLGSLVEPEVNRNLAMVSGPVACMAASTAGVAVVASSDAILLAVRAAAPELLELPIHPPLNATARFGLVTLVGRSEPPLLEVLRGLIGELLRD